MTKFKVKVYQFLIIENWDLFGICLLFIGIFLSAGCSTSLYIKEDIEQSVPPADESDILQRVLLIGDAGEPSSDFREPILKAMENQASLLPQKTINIFLGDNIYPYGFDESIADKLECERRLTEQVKVMESSNTPGIFIPGNHDWGNGEGDGWKKIKAQGDFISKFGNPGIQVLPEAGCPGPKYLDLGKDLRIIFLDTQWWLQNEKNKPLTGNCDCNPVTEDGIVYSLDSLIKSAGDKFILVVGHHPIDTYGPHGGYFDWKAHLFPLTEINKYLWIPFPVIGSIYPLSRSLGISSQDISSSLYKNMKDKLEKVISNHSTSHRRIVYASGHEHSLQVIKGKGDNLYLVSGYGTAIHANSLSYGDKSLFSALYPGFMQLDILRSDKVRLGVFIVNPETGYSEEIFSMWVE
jgi:hypothetical protein